MSQQEDPQVTIQRLANECNRLQEQVGSMQSIIVHQAAKELDEARKLTQMTKLAQSLEGERDRALRELSITKGRVAELEAQTPKDVSRPDAIFVAPTPTKAETERVAEPA